MTSVASVKDRLKNRAEASGKTYQETLFAYGLERTIYRLSVSQYAERFTLKGGVFLYAIFDGNFARATRDIDLLARNMSNSVEDIRAVFENVFSIECDDALLFDLSTLDVKNITEFKEYHGVNISIMGFLDKTKVPVSIDVGFGDVIYPDRVKMEFPTLLNMEVPEVYAYSLSSAVSEKFEAIVSLGDANSRYKDFYDIYLLATCYDFDGMELKEAFVETFNHRGTDLNDIYAFSDGFITSEIHQNRWNAFLRKKKTILDIGLEKVIELLKAFLSPVVDSILDSKEFMAVWNHEILRWNQKE